MKNRKPNHYVKLTLSAMFFALVAAILAFVVFFVIKFHQASLNQGKIHMVYSSKSFPSEQARLKEISKYITLIDSPVNNVEFEGGRTRIALRCDGSADT